jgi:hypothetical protein
MPVVSLLSQRAFDLAHVKAICDAFDSAWQSLRNCGSPLASEALAPSTRELLAKRIIEMAARGLRDPMELEEDALAHLKENPPQG